MNNIRCCTVYAACNTELQTRLINGGLSCWLIYPGVALQPLYKGSLNLTGHVLYLFLSTTWQYMLSVQ